MSSKRVRWLLGVIIVSGILYALIKYPLPLLFGGKFAYIGFLKRAFIVLLLSSLLCLFRVYRGPTAPDRIVAIDILGILIVGFCALLSIATGRSWYIDIGIAWALQSFISTLALSKYLEGRDFDE